MKRIFCLSLLLYMLNYSASFCQSWYPVDSGFNGIGGAISFNDGVTSMCNDSNHNFLWAAGQFITSGNDTVNHIAKFNGIEWLPLMLYINGDSGIMGFSEQITSIIIFQDKLLIAEAKNNIDHRANLYEINIDSGTFSFKATFDKNINSMYIYHDSLYVAGVFTNYKRRLPPYHFTQLGGIAKWNGTDFVDVGGGMGGSSVKDLCVYNDKLVAGGLFEYAGGVYCKNVAAWDGTEWSAFGNGLGDQWDYSVNIFAVQSYHGKLYAGGDFDFVATQVGQGLVYWDSVGWYPAGPGDFGFTRAMNVINDKLYIAGSCNFLPFTPHLYLNCFDGVSWSHTGNGPLYNVFAIENYNGYIYTGGEFLYVQNPPVYCGYVARLDTTQIPIAYNNLSIQICSDDSYSFNGMQLTNAGIYYDTLVAFSGGDSVIVLNLTINQPTSSSNTQSICEGDSYSFNGSILTNAGTYHDTLSNANNCDSLITLLLNVTSLNALISISNDTLTASGNGTMQWYDCNTNQQISGATNNTYIATGVGSYAAIITNGNCSDTTVCVTYIGVNDLPIADSELLIYPNPANETVTITANNIKEIVVTNLLGEIVQSLKYNVQSNTATIDISKLPQGIYLLRVQTNYGWRVGKVVKE